MNNSPQFRKPLLESTEHRFHSEQLNQITDTFQEGKYLEAFIQTLNTIKPGAVDKDVKSIDVTIPHGSVNIHIVANDKEYSITAPFLKVGDQGKLALLRQTAEINLRVLSLPQIELRDSELHYVYAAPIELSHPHKVYAVIQDICYNADYYDDMFIEKLHAVSLNEPQITEISADQKTAAWELFQTILKESLEYADYFEQKRRLDLVMCTLCTAVMNVDYTLQPQGFIRSDIEKTVTAMYDNSVQLSELVQRTKASVKKLLSLSQDTFNHSLYIPTFFVPLKPALDITSVESMFQGFQEQYKRSMANADYAEAAVGITWKIYDVLYRYTLPEDVKNKIHVALDAAANHPWQEAAKILMQALADISHTSTSN